MAPKDISNLFIMNEKYSPYLTLERALRIENILYVRVILNKDTPILNRDTIFRLDGSTPKFINCYGISGAYDIRDDYDIVESALLSNSGYRCDITTNAKVSGSVSITFISVFVQ